MIATLSNGNVVRFYFRHKWKDSKVKRDKNNQPKSYLDVATECIIEIPGLDPIKEKINLKQSNPEHNISKSFRREKTLSEVLKRVAELNYLNKEDRKIVWDAYVNR